MAALGKRLLFVCCILVFGINSAVAMAAGSRETTVAASSNINSRIVYGIEQLKETLDKYNIDIEIVAGSASKARPNTIIVGTADDGKVFKKAAKRIKGRKEAFGLICKPKSAIVIAGSDAAGAMYGCMELSERIETLGGELPANLKFYDEPKLKLRGPCIGLQRPEIIYDKTIYDYRYLPETFPWLYDRQHWIGFLDLMAKNRFNSLYLWNGHPFTSILKLPKYPEAQEVETEQLEKNIELFKWLCDEAQKRNIWIVQKHYNIHLSHTFARHHKIAYTHKHITPLVAEYNKYCYTEFIKNYPNVGLMMCLGEALREEVKWVTDVVIPGVKAGLKPGQSEPPVVIRAHAAPVFDVMAAAKPLYSNLYVMGKYTDESLASDQVGGGTNPWTERVSWEKNENSQKELASLAPMISNVHLVANLEPFRWGSPEFVRNAVKSLDDTGIQGLHLYPLRFWDWPYTADKVEPKMLQLDRDWMWYAAWARYSWNPYRDKDSEDKFWTNQLAQQFGTKEAGKAILSAYEYAGDVLPHIIRAYSVASGGNVTITVGQTMEQLFNSRRNYTPDIGETIVRYAQREVDGQKHIGETPLGAAEKMLSDAQSALQAAESSRVHVTKNKDEYERIVTDMKATVLVAKYYKHKVKAAIDGLIFNSTKSTDALTRSIKELEKSVDIYRELTELTDETYLDAAGLQFWSRAYPYSNPGHEHWTDILPEFEKELQLIKRNGRLLRAHPELLELETPQFDPIKITPLREDQPLATVLADEQPFSDARYPYSTRMLSEFSGLTTIKPSYHKCDKGDTIPFNSQVPARAFVAFFGRTNRVWASPPADWKLYAKGYRFRAKYKFDIYYKDFPAGDSVIDIGKGVFVPMGFTRQDVKLPSLEDNATRIMLMDFFSKPVKLPKASMQSQVNPSGQVKKIKIAQVKVYPVKGDLEANHKKLLAVLSEIEESSNVDVVITPEGFLDGYISVDKNVTKDDMVKYAIDPENSKYTKAISKWAKKNNAWVIYGCTRKADGGVYNTALIYDRKGQYVGAYDKLHLRRHDHKYIQGKHLNVYDSDFGKFGVMICADRNWPETSRTLALKGATVIFNPTYGSYNEFNEWKMRVRSRDDESIIAFTHPRQSLITGPTGKIITNNKDKTQTFAITEIDLSNVDKARATNAGHLSDRRPDVYKLN